MNVRHAGIGHNRGERRTVYAISFDMDTKRLESLYPRPSWQNAHSDIARALSEHGFERQQGSVRFGDETVTAVSCVPAVSDVARKLAWFGPSIRDARVLRIEENNDLAPAVAAATA